MDDDRRTSPVKGHGREGHYSYLENLPHYMSPEKKEFNL